MDYQRILIFMGLAVTGYLLMLAWQEDYGHQATRTQVESSTTERLMLFHQRQPLLVESLLPKRFRLILLFQM